MKKLLFALLFLPIFTVAGQDFSIEPTIFEKDSVGVQIIPSDSTLEVKVQTVEPDENIFISFPADRIGKLPVRQGGRVTFLFRIVNRSGYILCEVEKDIHNSFSTGVMSPSNLPQGDYSLSQNYPNPFNPTTTINFSLPKSGSVVLTVFNALGQEIETLVDANMPAGFHTVVWDAKNLPSGEYFYRLQSGAFVQTRKMVLNK